MSSKKTLVCLAALVYATMALAQFEQFGNQPPKRESAEERATRKAQQLRDTLNLDCDQFNSVYKVYYNEYSAMEQQMKPQGGPPPGGPGGMPPQGCCGGHGGMPPQGCCGGMPPQGAYGEMPAPPSQPKEQSEEQMKKQQDKRQKKMKKILTEEQYELWYQLDTINPPC